MIALTSTSRQFRAKTMAVNRMCKSCGRSIIVWSTAQTRCPKCQLARSKAKPPKPIAKIGKQGRKTAAAVAKWKKTQKPNHEGYYVCYMCGKWVEYLEAEHVKSKARHPELRTDPSNFKPTCDECNNKKRSNDN